MLLKFTECKYILILLELKILFHLIANLISKIEYLKFEATSNIFASADKYTINQKSLK